MLRLSTGTSSVVTLRTFLTRLVPLRTFQTRDVLGEGGDTSNSPSCVCLHMERWLCDNIIPYGNRRTADM
ncbi:hypothetical protein T12_15564 [Trichinella patagoniensis]|uniref:Uncharacterized protein n=1 Tax=Trichinella patagoniensis TaxID=990121 RepID=A0A0V0YUQ4_9BILA|nr:hypothetical protein T12_15564 [Trichinella patagoniensis]